MLWGMISALQLITHMRLIEVICPGNAHLLFTFIDGVSSFDFIETNTFLPQLFELPMEEEEPFN